MSQTEKDSFQIWLAGSAVCDVLIALSMIYVVRGCSLDKELEFTQGHIQLSKANSTYKATRNLIRRLIILTMETGTLTGKLVHPF